MYWTGSYLGALERMWLELRLAIMELVMQAATRIKVQVRTVDMEAFRAWNVAAERNQIRITSISDVP